MKYNEEYTTTDIGFATTLVVCDFELLSIRQSEHGDRATFVFKKEEGMKEIENDYFYDRIDVSPFKFMMTLKTLKSRLYSNY
jgi:hypothetical protein